MIFLRKKVLQHLDLLENNLVRLEPLKKEHTEKLNLLVDPELWKYSFLAPVEDQSSLDAFVEKFTNDEKKLPLIIEDKKTGLVAGTTTIFKYKPQEQKTSLGFTRIAKQFQKSYVNRSAKTLVIDFLFSNTDINRVEFDAAEENTNSNQSLVKFGAKFFGKDTKTKGDLSLTFNQYCIKREDWEFK